MVRVVVAAITVVVAVADNTRCYDMHVLPATYPYHATQVSMAYNVCGLHVISNFLFESPSNAWPPLPHIAYQMLFVLFTRAHPTSSHNVMLYSIQSNTFVHHSPLR